MIDLPETIEEIDQQIEARKQRIEQCQLVIEEHEEDREIQEEFEYHTDRCNKEIEDLCRYKRKLTKAQNERTISSNGN